MRRTLSPATALALWLALITLAWWAVAPAQLGIDPLVNAQGEATGWWQLRRHAIYLTGLWCMGLMGLIMVLALRLPLIERPLGGMDQVYRLHKWAGMGAGITALLHWGVKEGGGLIKATWGREGKPAHDAVLPWFTDARDLAKDLGEWAFYALLVLIALLPGGACRGELHLEEAGRAHATLDALWEREMPGGGVYQPRWLQALTPQGRLPALAFTLPPRHPSHVGRLDDAALLRILAQARGRYGSTLDYLLRTAERLDQLGIRDAEVSRLVDLAERHGLTDRERRLGRDQPLEILAGVDVDQHAGVARLDRE